MPETQRRYIQRVHSGVQSVPKCQPTSGLAAMLKATKISETNMSEYERDPQKAL